MSGARFSAGEHALDVSIGARLRGRRVELGFSQEKLAILIGTSFQQIQKYERGVNRIAASRLVSIARVLAIAPAYFLEGPSALLAGAEPMLFGERWQLELIKAVTRLPPATQAAVRDFVRSLAHTGDAA